MGGSLSYEILFLSELLFLSFFNTKTAPVNIFKHVARLKTACVSKEEVEGSDRFLSKEFKGRIMDKRERK